MKTLQYIFLFIVIAGAQTFAQSNSIDSTFHSIESQFESGSYVNAEVEARRLLEIPALSDSARVIAEKWIAFSLVAQGKSSLAGDHFSLLLKLNPQFELDPILTSPKILAVFNETKAHLAVHVNPEMDTVAVQSFRQSMEVSFRTIVFPGWEQLHTNRTTAGYIFLGGGIGTLGAGIAFEALRSSARSGFSRQQLHQPLKQSIPHTTNTTKQKHTRFRHLLSSILFQKLTSSATQAPPHFPSSLQARQTAPTIFLFA